MILPSNRQRERLQGLMLVRVILVTAFLGSAIAIDAAEFADVSEPRNLTLIALIVATYLMTIGYALGLVRGMRPSRLAHLQLVGDLFITTILALVTGGFDSLFLFFYHLTIINAAIVAGYRTALVVATVTATCMAYFAAITLGWLPHPVLDTELPPVSAASVVYEVLVNSLAGFLIAVLAGQLARRLGRATAQLKRQKSDIADLQALNENILASMNSGLLTIDRNGIVIFYNEAAEEITGLPSHEVLGRSLERIFPELAQAVAAEDPTAPTTRLEHSFERRDGTQIHLGFSISPLQSSAGDTTGSIVIFQDLTDIKELQQRMRRSERLAAVGELSAAIAHEIRNPLASISGSVEMLDLHEEQTDENRMLMNIIVREVERLDHLIGDFLEYCQPRQLETSHQPVIPIIEDVITLFGGRTDAPNVDVEITERPDRQPIVDIDAESFQQILWNLLKNAQEAVENEPEQRHRIYIEIDVSADESELVLAVEDDGPGVAPETEDRLFEPFFTTREEGSGLGLATTYRLLQDQNGYIELAESRNLHGARFEISLPLVALEPKSVETEDTPEMAEPSAAKEGVTT